MKLLKALLAATLLAPLPAYAGAPPIPPAPTIINGGGTPVIGTCPSTQFLYNNAGVIGCSVGGAASMSIGGAVTGGTAGYGLYVNGASLGQFAYGSGIFTALGLASNATSGLPLINGTLTAGDCLKWNALGITDAGAACGSGGGSVFPVTVSGTVTSGGIPYFSSTTTMATSTALAANALVVGGGAGAAPTTVTTGAGVLTALGIAANASGGHPTVNGAITNGNCLNWSTTLGITDAGAACGGGGSGTVSSGTTNTLAFYASNGTTVGPLTLGTNLSITGSTLNAAGGGGTLTVGTTATSGGASGQIMFDGGALLQESVNLLYASSILQVGQSTTAQSFRVANTWSSSGANYEYGIFDWQTTANVLTIGTTNGGTGLARNLQFVVGGANELDYGISQSGAWYSPNSILTGLSNGGFQIGTNLTRQFLITGYGSSNIVNLAYNWMVGWGSGATVNTNADVNLSRISAGVLAVGSSATVGDATGTLRLAALQSAGTVPTTTTGTCTTIGAASGGATAGKFTTTTGCGASTTIILSGMPTVTTGYACNAQDQTTPADTVQQTASSTTSATFKVSATATSDVISYHCTGY